MVYVGQGIGMSAASSANQVRKSGDLDTIASRLGALTRTQSLLAPRRHKTPLPKKDSPVQHVEGR